MPFQIRKIKDKFKLYNLEKKQYVNISYKTKESALSASKNFMRYAYSFKKTKPKIQKKT